MGASWSAPVRSLFNRGKVKEEVQQGVEVVVSAAEQGLQRLDTATSGAVTNLADELSNAGVDLSQFKNNLVHAIDDAHRVENEVGTSVTNVAGSVENGLKDEFHHVETQTEVGISKAGAAVKGAIPKVEKTTEEAIQKLEQTKEEVVAEVYGAAKKTENAVVENVSSLTSDMASFGESAGASIANGLQTVEASAEAGVEKAKETAEVVEKKVEDIASNAEQTASEWTTSLLTKEKQLADEAKEAVSQKKEEVSSGIAAGVKVAEETASAGVEKVAQGLSSLQESLDSKKEEVSSQVKEVVANGANTVTESLDNLQKETEDKKNEVASGLSSELHFLRDTVVASKDIVVETLQKGRYFENAPPKSPPSKFPSTTTSTLLSSSSDTQEEKSADATEESKLNGTNNEEVEEMGDKEEKKETPPIKEVTEFLSSEISDASNNLEAKKEEVKEGVTTTNGATAAANDAQVESNSIFDSLTDIGSSITNTLHNIESDIEYTGKTILTGVGTKVKEAGEFIAGTEEEIDQNMDDKELKTEAVTSILDNSLLK
ncbi:neurofilament medium polypeptide-like isoform X2 [Harmonia axyridis]|uniref:neurofilament medium polypeptide-like isoform X2 n=1 Tax=Harmonia axyridis TaxID=115357 RepID=UPI001E279AB2|nr:neurofilament medium polypeptide-like isoform X2 [Harmonia axyridis]